MTWIVSIFILLFSSHLFGLIIYNRFRVRKTLSLIEELDLDQDRKKAYNNLINEYSGFMSFLAIKPHKTLYPELYVDRNNESFFLKSKKRLVYLGIVVVVSLICTVILDSNL